MLPQLVAVAFSAENSFLQTFQRPQKEAGNGDKNLKVPVCVCLFSLHSTPQQTVVLENGHLFSVVCYAGLS